MNHITRAQMGNLQHGKEASVGPDILRNLAVFTGKGISLWGLDVPPKCHGQLLSSGQPVLDEELGNSYLPLSVQKR